MDRQVFAPNNSLVALKRKSDTCPDGSKEKDPTETVFNDFHCILVRITFTSFFSESFHRFLILRSEIRKWRNLALTMLNSGELARLQLKARNRRSSFLFESWRLSVPGEKLPCLVVKWLNLGFSLYLVRATTLVLSAFSLLINIYQ